MTETTQSASIIGDRMQFRTVIVSRTDAVDSVTEDFGNPSYKCALEARAHYGGIPAPWALADQNTIEAFAL